MAFRMTFTAGCLALTGALIAACGGSAVDEESSSTDSLQNERVFPNPPAPPPTLEDFNGDFPSFMARLVALKPAVMARQQALLDARYDLSNKPSRTCKDSKGKPVQGGTRMKLPPGVTWSRLSQMTPAQVKALDLFPAGFMPLPHANHPEGGMLFPPSTILELKTQTGRDLQRFDLDFDLPEHFLPSFPPAIFLTTRKDLGDVSRGKLVTTQNYFGLFKDILNVKQLDGLRLLVTPFAQQQFNLTDDRRSAHPSLGVACLDCHVNGSTNGANHLVGDIRPQAFRNRIETPSLRGLNVQKIFGSQRALTSVEDFTEFEQRAAYFDGDIDKAAKKGINPLDRASQVHHMAEMQKLFAFPPSKLGVLGKLDTAQATPSELRGQNVFFGKGRCATCHAGDDFTDNSMHDLQMERFYEHRMINGQQTKADGPIKTFTLRGIKDSAPYFHDGRLLTLEDTVEFFNLVLELGLSEPEKDDLTAYLCAI